MIGLCRTPLLFTRIAREKVSFRQYILRTMTSSMPMESHYMFAEHKIPEEVVFYATDMTFAFVNIKPVVEGHVLVSPVRCIERFTELSQSELTDLFTATQKVSKKIEKYFNASSLTVAIQDGPDAGQTVKHVHVHVLPRKKGDFVQNDQIYGKLQENEIKLEDSSGQYRLDQNPGAKLRSFEEMAKEASALRALFE